MKIQNPGRVEGPAKTPQKIKVKENIKLATFPPVSGVSIPAMTRLVKVEVKRRKVQMNRNIKPPRSVTAPVGSAFR